MHGLKLADIEVDRKILADLAVAEPRRSRRSSRRPRPRSRRRAKAGDRGGVIRSRAANPRLKRARRLRGGGPVRFSGCSPPRARTCSTRRSPPASRRSRVLAVPDGGAAVEPAAGRAGRCSPRSARSATRRGCSRSSAPPTCRASRRRPTLTLELHGVRDPGNVGTLLRSLAAFGPASAVLWRRVRRPDRPEAVRASMGAIFAVPVLTDGAGRPARPRGRARRDGGAPLAGVDLRGPVTFLVGARARRGIPDGVAYDIAAHIPQTPGDRLAERRDGGHGGALRGAPPARHLSLNFQLATTLTASTIPPLRHRAHRRRGRARSATSAFHQTAPPHSHRHR